MPMQLGGAGSLVPRVASCQPVRKHPGWCAAVGLYDIQHANQGQSHLSRQPHCRVRQPSGFIYATRDAAGVITGKWVFHQCTFSMHLAVIGRHAYGASRDQVGRNTRHWPRITRQALHVHSLDRANATQQARPQQNCTSSTVRIDKVRIGPDRVFQIRPRKHSYTTRPCQSIGSPLHMRKQQHSGLT